MSKENVYLKNVERELSVGKRGRNCLKTNVKSVYDKEGPVLACAQGTNGQARCMRDWGGKKGKK